MDFRKSISKPFKKLKGRLPGGRHKRDRGSGSEDSRKEGQADAEGDEEASQRNSNLRSDFSIEDVVGSDPGGEGSNVDGKEAALLDVGPPTSTPSTSHIGEPDGT